MSKGVRMQSIKDADILLEELKAKARIGEEFEFSKSSSIHFTPGRTRHLLELLQKYKKIKKTFAIHGPMPAKYVVIDTSPLTADRILPKRLISDYTDIMRKAIRETLKNYPGFELTIPDIIAMLPEEIKSTINKRTLAKSPSAALYKKVYSQLRKMVETGFLKQRMTEMGLVFSYPGEQQPETPQSKPTIQPRKIIEMPRITKSKKISTEIQPEIAIQIGDINLILTSERITIDLKKKP